MTGNALLLRLIVVLGVKFRWINSALPRLAYSILLILSTDSIDWNISMFAIASVWIGIVTLSQQVVNSLTEVHPVYMLTFFR
jgi:hypothetical protein